MQYQGAILILWQGGRKQEKGSWNYGIKNKIKLIESTKLNDMSNDLIYIVCGLAGVVFHSLLKLNSLLTDARKANMDFNWYKDYVYKDFVSISMALLSVGIWYLVFHEIADKYHGIQDFARVSYVTMGALGSYVIQLFMSRAKKQIRKVIDEKTNIADGKE